MKINKEKLEKQLQQWEQQKPLLMEKQDLQEDIQQTKNRKKPPKAQRKRLTTTKALMLFLFISCSAIEVFTMYAIIKGMNMGLGIDFTPLTMLITSVVAEVIGFSVYSLKSMKQNTKGGIVYQTAMLNNIPEDQYYEEEDQKEEQEYMG